MEYISNKESSENIQQINTMDEYKESDNIMDECIREVFYDINSYIWY